MKISVLSVFPELYKPFLETSLIKKAQENKLVNIQLADFFSFAAPKERIDAPTFGHGAGMLLKPDIIQRAIENTEEQRGSSYKIFFSPHGKKLTQKLLNSIMQKSAEHKHVMLVPARYEGMDARVEEYYADEIISVGDFVLMGGDIPAMIFLEGFMRLIPGIIGKQESVEHESFTGPFVDYPEYTEPVVWKGMSVPDVVRSGNHNALQRWRQTEAVKRTVLHHFEWLKSYPLNSEQKKITLEQIPHHYIALLHSNVVLGDQDKIGTTSVTSLDIHDIARSSKTYGIKKFFVVTPLKDQQKIVGTLLDFWQTGYGSEYNKHRHEAIKDVQLVAELEQVKNKIYEIEGQVPLVIATSARDISHSQMITFYDYEKVWEPKRPVLFVFGTGKGLSDEFLAQCDYLLLPVVGLTDFNHLSVRSAVAIILDRWLGNNVKN
ncbi:MAG: tRNA (guanosine(37)-N1)-methyltransferase TrmD [Candidatus Dependentiae bacterium]